MARHLLEQRKVKAASGNGSQRKHMLCLGAKPGRPPVDRILDTFRNLEFFQRPARPLPILEKDAAARDLDLEQLFDEEWVAVSEIVETRNGLCLRRVRQAEYGLHHLTDLVRAERAEHQRMGQTLARQLHQPMPKVRQALLVPVGADHDQR